MEIQSAKAADAHFCSEVISAWEKDLLCRSGVKYPFKLLVLDECLSTMDFSSVDHICTELTPLSLRYRSEENIPDDLFGQLPLLTLSRTQIAGRGRNRREWVSEANNGIYFSLAFQLSIDVQKLEGLTLAVGVILGRALQTLGLDIKLKWPNDLVVVRDDVLLKLGGILVESRQKSDTCSLVIGVGINLASPSKDIGVRVTSLSEELHEEIDYAAVFASIALELLSSLPLCFRAGFAPFRSEWLAQSALQDRRVRISRVVDKYSRVNRDSGENGGSRGTVCGVDERGALQISLDPGKPLSFEKNLDRKIVSVNSGEVVLE